MHNSPEMKELYKKQTYWLLACPGIIFLTIFILSSTGNMDNTVSFEDASGYITLILISAVVFCYYKFNEYTKQIKRITGEK